jgi:transcriptional antiterminator RfaH
MSSGRPCPAPVGVVEALLASSDKQGIVHFGGELREGQRIMVTAGPFGELLGVLERLDDDGRARILLDVMGGRVLVTLPREAIFPAAR